MSQVTTVYDSSQHCKATKIPQNIDVEMDCPYTGKGEKFSPGELLESALAGCMLISMGTLATRNNIDISGTKISIDIAATIDSVMRYTGITVNVEMASNFDETVRQKLERAAEACPIKHSFKRDIPVTVNYTYPE